jgi:hypothetical protein
MKYRELGNTGLVVSEVGLGCEGMIGATPDLVKELVTSALDCGMNFFDLFCAEPDVRSNLGNCLKGRRDKVFIQGHIGACWQNSQYLRTRDEALVPAGFEDLLKRLDTDYLDIGMIHYVDNDADFDTVFGGWMIDYVLELKKAGRIRHTGMSSHNPEMALKAAETGLIDVLLFSVNPCYDLQPPREDFDEVWTPRNYEQPLTNIDPVRDQLYKTCEAKGVGIVVMKAFGGGDLLSDKWSPFGRAMKPEHCIHYALTRPAAACVVGGFRSAEEVLKAGRYSDLTDQERDYAPFLKDLPLHSYKGKCIYCGHCAPCPVGINIAMVNKFHDLALVQGSVPDSVRSHYELLEHHAGECIACGQCLENCPFEVPIIQKMAEAAETFGR